MKINKSDQITYGDLHYNRLRVYKFDELKSLPERVPPKYLGRTPSTYNENSIIAINSLDEMEDSKESISGHIFYVHRACKNGLLIAQKVHNKKYYISTGNGETYITTSEDIFKKLNENIIQQDELSYTLKTHPLATLGLLEKEHIEEKIMRVKTVSDEWLIQQMGKNDMIKYLL